MDMGVDMLHFLFTQIPGIVLGLGVGVFCPSVARKLKAMFVKEAKVVEGKL